MSEILEKRMTSLEEKLLGKGGAGSDRNSQKLLDELVTINNKLVSSVGKKEKTLEALKRLDEIKAYSDQTQMESMTISPESKTLVIESCTGELERRVELLEILESFLPVLDSEHIRNAPSLQPKLEAMALKQITLNDQVSSHSEETSRLVHEYNRVITEVNRQLAYWDKSLSALERK